RSMMAKSILMGLSICLPASPGPSWTRSGTLCRSGRPIGPSFAAHLISSLSPHFFKFSHPLTSPTSHLLFASYFCPATICLLFFTSYFYLLMLASYVLLLTLHLLLFTSVR